MPRFPCAVPVACWWLSLSVWAWSLLGFVAGALWSALLVQFSFLWFPSLEEARNWPVLWTKRKGTDLKTGSDPKITLKLKSGSFGGHPRG